MRSHRITLSFLAFYLWIPLFSGSRVLVRTSRAFPRLKKKTRRSSFGQSRISRLSTIFQTRRRRKDRQQKERGEQVFCKETNWLRIHRIANCKFDLFPRAYFTVGFYRISVRYDPIDNCGTRLRYSFKKFTLVFDSF